MANTAGNSFIHSCLIAAAREGNIERLQTLIDSRSLTDFKDGGYFILCAALERKQKDIVKLLLGKDVNVNYINSNFGPPLHFAIKNGFLDIIKLLCDKGVDINAPDNQFKKTPLHFAVEYKKIEVVEFLCSKGANVNQVRDDNVTPLLDAIQSGFLKIAKLLLQNNACVNMQSTDGTSPLHVAAKKGFVKLGEELTNLGANINCKINSGSENGYSSLHIACKNKHIDFVKLLLNKNADINAYNVDKQVPLNIAINSGDTALVKLLLESGAKVNEEDISGKSILYHAVVKGDPIIVSHILNFKPNFSKANILSLYHAIIGNIPAYGQIIAALFEYGFRPKPADVYNFNVLNGLIQKGCYNVVGYLLNYTKNVSRLNELCRDQMGFTLLHTACIYKHENLVQLLINYGVDVNIKDDKQKAPILYAIMNRDIKISELLIANGAIIKNNPDIFKIAVSRSCPEVVELILEHDSGLDVHVISQPSHNLTALHVACLIGCNALVKKLLSEKNDINASIKFSSSSLSNYSFDMHDGYTPLHCAIYKEHAGTVQLLLMGGANINICSKEGLSPLHLAVSMGYKRNKIGIIEYTEIIEILLKHKDININAVDKKENTPLHYTVMPFISQFSESESAAIPGKIADLLISKGANLDAKNGCGMTSLQCAADGGFLGVADVIIHNECNINAVDKEGKSALHIAISSGQAKIVSLLLQMGCDLNIVCESGFTACEVAVQCVDLSFAVHFAFGDEEKFSEIAGMVIRQIIKFNALGFYLCDKNFKLLENFREFLIEAFQNECHNEIEKMKEKKIANTVVSFYDFIIKGVNQLARYLKNENIISAVESCNFEVMFPIYKDMIVRNIKKGKEKLSLYGPSVRCLNALFAHGQDLPELCAKEILTYLSNRDLKTLITSVNGDST